MEIWSDFSQWLSQENGIYWIQGKPGSGKSRCLIYCTANAKSNSIGKSCLMKYLTYQEETRELLVKWAGEAPLIIASFFFWYPGTPMQKSQNGLLRSLLHQIISQQPLLIPIAFPEAWDSFNENLAETLEMSRGELIRAVSRVLSQTVFELKICLFIDGLDEYEGDHAEIVALFEGVLTSESTKICVSSRPWLVFKNSFANHPTLKLQDLTKDDIEKYINEMLGESNHMAELQERESDEAASLIQDIARKSSGVFLWVTLVVRSLLTGLLNNDCISDLKRRLEQLPSDLEELYIHMLRRIDPFYLQQAIRLFVIVQKAHRPLPSLVVSIVDDYDPSASLASDIVLMAETDVASRCRKMEDKIQSRCLGLLECVNRAHPTSISASVVDFPFLDDLMYVAGFESLSVRVQYMHRTVVDFLEKEENWTKLLGSLKDDSIFHDVYQALCFSSLVQLKQIFSPSRYGMWASAYRPFAALVRECIDYAVKVETLTNGSATMLLDELNRTCAIHFHRAMKKANVPWAKTWVHTLLSSEPEVLNQQTMFLALAIEYKLERYLSEKMDQIRNSITPSDLQYLLNFTLRPEQKSNKILKLLLATGADLNAGEKGITPWQKVLKYAWHVSSVLSTSIERRQQLQEILDCCICHDAATDALIQIPSGNPQQGLNQSIPAVTVVALVGNARVLGVLLDRGADPNRAHGQSTPWMQSITYVYQELPKLVENRPENAEGTVQDWLKKFTLFLEYGANPRSFISISPSGMQGLKPRHVSVLTVINEVFSRWDERGAADLQARLPLGLAVELRQLQAREMIPSPPVSPAFSDESNKVLSPEDAAKLRQKMRYKKRDTMNKIFSALRK